MTVKASKSNYGVSRATARTPVISPAGVPYLEVGGTESEMAQTVNDLMGSTTYQAQAAWYINATAGNDGNAGTLAAPIKTFAEFARRTRGLRVDTTIYVMSNIPNGDPPDFSQLLARSSVVVTGLSGATQLGTGTITAVQAVAPATNLHLEIEASGLSGSWTALGYIYRAIRLTSGADAGAIGFAAYDLAGANRRVRTTQFRSAGASTAFVTPGAVTFEVLQFPIINDYPVDPPESVIVRYRCVEFKINTWNFDYDKGLSGRISLLSVAFSPDPNSGGGSIQQHYGEIYGFGCLFYGTGGNYVEYSMDGGSRIELNGSAVVGATTYFSSQNEGSVAMRFANYTLFQSTAGSVVQDSYCSLEDCAFFDCTSRAILFYKNSRINITGYIYGANSPYVFSVYTNVVVTYQDKTKLVAATTTAAIDWKGGVGNVTWAMVPYIDRAYVAGTSAGTQSMFIPRT